MAFPDWTENDVKTPRIYQLTSVDFVFPLLETCVRSAVSQNGLKLIFLTGLWKGTSFWQILAIKNWINSVNKLGLKIERVKL